MTETVDLKLKATFGIAPEELIAVRQRVPCDSRNFIPLRIFDKPFSMTEPTLVSLGGGAVAMSLLGGPFGFMRCIDDTIVESQQADRIILTPNAVDRESWLMTLKTELPFTERDLELFSTGIQMYGAYAEGKLIYQSSLRAPV